MSDIEIKEKIKEYYNQNNKPMIFKSTHKNKCAESISMQFDIDTLLKQTIYMIPNANKVYIDYTIFKTYAHEGIYDKVVQHILSVFSECIHTFGSFEAHLNLKSFTMSAACRHANIIKLFCSVCLQSDTQFSTHIDKFIVYNTPSMIDGISKMFQPFINDRVRSRVQLISTADSENLLRILSVTKPAPT